MIAFTLGLVVGVVCQAQLKVLWAQFKKTDLYAKIVGYFK